MRTAGVAKTRSTRWLKYHLVPQSVHNLSYIDHCTADLPWILIVTIWKGFISKSTRCDETGKGCSHFSSTLQTHADRRFTIGMVTFILVDSPLSSVKRRIVPFSSSASFQAVRTTFG